MNDQEWEQFLNEYEIQDLPEELESDELTKIELEELSYLLTEQAY